MSLYYSGLKKAYSLNPSLSKLSYQGFDVFQSISWIGRKIIGGKYVEPVDMMASVCRFFVLYIRKAEIKYGETKVLQYFPALPEATFFRANNKEYYLDHIKKGSAVERMKELVDSEIDLASKYRAGYMIYKITNFPIGSEIVRWDRLWIIMCILLSIVLNIFILATYTITNEDAESTHDVLNKISEGNIIYEAY